jgi:transposase-like protein
MRCPACQSTVVREPPERTAQGYRRFRCLTCTKQFNERSGGVLNQTQHPTDIIAMVVLWLLRYKLSLRDLTDMNLRRRCKGRVGRSWYTDEKCIRVRGRWRYLYHAIDATVCWSTSR